MSSTESLRRTEPASIFGAFTSANNDASNHFATDLIGGDAIVLEYYEPAQVAGLGRINIFRVTHGYRGGEDYYKSFGRQAPAR